MISSPDLALMQALSNPPVIVAKAQVQMRGWGNVQLSDEPGFKKVITSCADVRGYANISPEMDVIAYLGYREDPKKRTWSPLIDFDRDVKISVLQRPKHGIVGEGVQGGPGTYGYKITERNPDGTPSYYGTDRVVYQVEVKGQKFKVVFNLLSIPDIEWVGDKQSCEAKRFGLSDVPNGTFETWLANAQLSALLSQASGISLAPSPASESIGKHSPGTDQLIG